METKEVILRYSIKTIDDIHCSKKCRFFFGYRVYDGCCSLGRKVEELRSNKNKFLRTKLCKICEAADEN